MSDENHDHLIAIVANELRYPLAPMRNAAALLRQNSPDSVTLRRVADVIERQASGMSRLIGDLVDLSSMQPGALELRRVRAPLAELMGCVVESAGPLLLERGHTLAMSVASEAIYLQMDVLRLDQALRHALLYAARNAHGHGLIHVRAERVDGQAVIRVSAGLESPSGTGPGLGLGLYLARFLIEAHQGTVTAASAGPGQGSELTIRLPCELPTPAKDPPSDGSGAGDPSPA